ncbi:MAG: DNA polymerase-1 [Verrucomicrobiales bacterium]
MEVYMVTPDKDFAQLVTARTKIYKPGRSGGEAEILGVEEILEKWEIERPEQVIDILGLWGDASDNIPGIPGIGEKTAKKLMKIYGSVEELIKNTDQLKGKQKENVINFAEQGLLSKRLATIILDVPIEFDWDDFKMGGRNDEKLREIIIEFEFNALGKRYFGKDFKAGRGFESEEASEGVQASLKTIKDVKHKYTLIEKPADRADLIAELEKRQSFCFDIETTDLDEKVADILGIAFSWKAHTGFYVAFPTGRKESIEVLEEFRELFARADIEKIGHNLKYDLGVLAWCGMEVAGPFFDTMLAHILVMPEQKHTMNVLAEKLLGYTPIPITEIIGKKEEESGQMSMFDIAPATDLKKMAEYAAEDADVTWQLADKLRPLLKETGQEKVFFEIEAPVLPVLIAMEREGIALDKGVLKEMGERLATDIEALEKKILEQAPKPFNLNSPKQLGEILFDEMQLVAKPKKTATGQYKTDETVLQTLAPDHQIVADILDYREATKLKSTYVDALPASVHPQTGRVHTNYMQLVTATGRLASNHPNLQNIPVRTEMGREIRKAFVPRDDKFILLAADYSQIELRVMAEISGDTSMRQAFNDGLDIHLATAAKVHGVALDEVTAEMRRSAKMVNFGIIFGISAFGLARNLGIARGEAKSIIDAYFNEYPGVKNYMEETVAKAKENGYVETMTGRRRHLRDINSSSHVVRSAAERTAINTPIQGTAADMIKIAMVNVAKALDEADVKSRMLLQVHDELVFDLARDEEDVVVPLVVNAMQSTVPMEVPIVVDTGTGENWLEAH